MTEVKLGPPIPGFIDRVNFITSYFWQGCEAPFRLFVTLAGPPAGRAVALLIGIDIDDIVKTFFRPAGLRSHRHGRKGARGRRRLPELPDVNEEIGKRIPGYELFRGRPFGSATQLVFEISDVYDRVAWNVAILDVVSDTVYQGLLGIIALDNTNCPWVGRGSGHFFFNTLNSYGDEWRAKNNSIIDYSYGVDMVQFGCGLDHQKTYLATHEIQFHKRTPGVSTVGVAIGDTESGEIFASSFLATMEEGDELNMTCSGGVRGTGSIEWLYHASGGFCDADFSRATVFQTG